MPLQPPKHIVEAAIDVVEIDYDWDDGNVQPTYLDGDAEVATRARPLSHRARAALAIAIGEWILHRFRHLADPHYELTRDYITALWVWNMDSRYVVAFRPDDREWLGPVLGPLELILVLGNHGYEMTEEHGPTEEAPAWMCQLARYVLPDVEAFDAWLEIVLGRLEAHHPDADDPDDFFEENDYRGDPVPRVLFDSNRPYDATLRDQHLAEFLTWAAAHPNALLRPPDELVARGWDSPYAPYSWPPDSSDRR